jgi:hypothetical protein
VPVAFSGTTVVSTAAGAQALTSNSNIKVTKTNFVLCTVMVFLWIEVCLYLDN